MGKRGAGHEARTKLTEVHGMLVRARDNLRPQIANMGQQIAQDEAKLQKKKHRLRAVEAGIAQINQLLQFLPDDDDE